MNDGGPAEDPAPLSTVEQATADLLRPELVPGLNSRRFNPKLLDNPEISERGEIVDTDEGPGQLIRTPHLEGISWNVAVEYILRNPHQPRLYFKPEAMNKLKGTIGSSGQETDIDVIPVKLQKTGQIKLFILDGERRYRVMKNELAFNSINAKIKYVSNFRELFKKSFLINESRDPHNAIERADNYRYLLATPDQTLGRCQTVAELAEDLGVEPNDIYNHLRLLDLDPAIQNLVITERLPKSSAFQFAATARNLGDKLDQARLAREILQELTGNDVKGSRKPRQIRSEDLARKVLEILAATGEEESAEGHAAAKATLGITTGAGRAKYAADKILSAKPQAVITALKARTTPPEAVADVLRTAIAELTASLGLVEAAARAPALPEIPGKPKFSEYITNQHQATFGNTRRKIALLLASHSDGDQEPITSKEIADVLDLDTMSVGSQLRFLKTELENIGLELEEHEIRVLNDHDEYQKVPAYRISWRINDKSEKTVLVRAAEAQFANEAVAEAALTRQRVLQTLGANQRSLRASPVIDEQDVPAITEVKDKPSYMDALYLNKKEINPGRLVILIAMAKESDGNGKPLSAAEIAERIPGSNSMSIANNMRFLKADLPKFGLALQQFTFLRQNNAGENVRITCYRLVWKKLADTQKTTPPKETLKKITTTEAAVSDPELLKQIAQLREELAAANKKIDENAAAIPVADQSKRIDKLRKELEGKEAELAAAKTNLNTKTREIAELRELKATLGGQLRMKEKEIEGLTKQLEKLRTATNGKGSPTLTLLSSAPAQAAELIEDMSFFEFIEANEEKFAEPLDFEIAKLLAETHDRNEPAMSSDDILELLKEDYKDLNIHKIGKRIAFVRSALRLLGIDMETIKVNSINTFALKKMAVEELSPATPDADPEQMAKLKEELERLQAAMTKAQAAEEEAKTALQNDIKRLTAEITALKDTQAKEAGKFTDDIAKLTDENAKLSRDLNEANATLEDLTGPGTAPTAPTTPTATKQAPATPSKTQTAPSPTPATSPTITPPAVAFTSQSTPKPTHRAKPTEVHFEDPITTLKSADIRDIGTLINLAKSALALHSADNPHGMHKANLRELRNALTNLDFGQQTWIHEKRVAIVKLIKKLYEENGDPIPAEKVEECMDAIDRLTK